MMTQEQIIEAVQAAGGGALVASPGAIIHEAMRKCGERHGFGRNGNGWRYIRLCDVNDRDCKLAACELRE